MRIRTAAALAAFAPAALFAAEPFTPVFIVSSTNVTPSVFPELSVFREAIPSYPVNSSAKIKRFTPLAKSFKYPKEYVRRLTEKERRQTPYRFEEMFADPANSIDSEYARNGKPFFVYERISRPPYFLPRDGAPLAIRSSYEEWKKKHPGFLGFNSLWELDSDSTYFQRFYNRMKDPSIEAELHEAFGPPDEKGIAHRRRWAEKVFKIAEDFHFGEKRIYPLCSNFPGYEHIFAAMGAAGLWYEATTQGYGAWNTAGAFVRGAARQRGLYFGWYMAQYYTGFDRNGKVLVGDSRHHVSHDGGVASEPRPHRGESRSMHKRQMLYGWLIGAKYLQTEGWPQFYMDRVDGKLVPTENALDFEEAYQRSKRIERGDTFTPLAVLTPLDEPTASSYRNDQMVEPEVQKDIFDTLVPIRGDSGEDIPKRKIGEQGCLFNSEFGGFFDVLCPDSGQDSAAFAKALSRYRHVLLAGNAFDKGRFDSAAIAAFEKSGGKVHRYPSPECPTKEKLRELLLKVQDETMPVEVKGDVQWGVNKTSKGWLVWFINNKGVVKFVDEPEEFRMERTAHVVAKMKSTGEMFEADVAPGDFKLWEVSVAPCASAAEVAFAPNVQPAPASMSVESNLLVRLDRGQMVSIACAAGADEAVRWAEDRFEEWFRFTKSGWLFSSVNAPQVKAAKFEGAPVKGGDEAYELEAGPQGVMVRANTLQGVRYALYTMRQTMLAMPRDARRTEWYAMPAMKVADAPAMKFRGIHIPWNMKSTPVEIEKRVRLSAYLKYNYAVIEPWGAFHSRRHPWWGWKEGTMTPSEIRRIVKVGKELGITLVPQIPAFGHASMGITSPGRHAILDAHGEYAPLFESLNGWNWCLSNPETLKVQFELIDELMELFDNPPYFHIGCDEAAKPNCPKCLASDYRALVVKHILALHDGLKARGAKTMLWHDMFLKAGDARWKGFYANGTEETVKAFESFPRDIVVCDWFYGKAAADYPSLRHFKEMGFEVLTCPWHERGGTAAQGVAARELGILGMMVTSWGDGQGKQRGKVYADIFAAGAAAAWGTPYVESPLWKWGYDLDLIRNLRDVVHDMHLEDFADSGTYQD